MKPNTEISSPCSPNGKISGITLGLANMSLPQSRRASQTDHFFLTSGVIQGNPLPQQKDYTSKFKSTRLSPISSGQNSVRQKDQQGSDSRRTSIISASESFTSFLHKNSLANIAHKPKASIPSVHLPQVQETVKQKMRIEQIISKCRKLQEKEALGSRFMKTNAQQFDEAFHQDFDKLQKKIKIILSMNQQQVKTAKEGMSKTSSMQLSRSDQKSPPLRRKLSLTKLRFSIPEMPKGLKRSISMPRVMARQLNTNPI